MTVATNYLNFKSTAINVAASGDRELVAADASNKINVHAMFIKVDATGGDIRFEDGAAGTALTGVMIMNASAFINLSFSEIPWFSTSVNTALSLEVGLAAVDGFMIYSLTTS